MVAEIHLKSIPATQSLTVFEGRYWSLQKLHSLLYIYHCSTVVDISCKQYFSDEKSTTVVAMINI